MHSYNILLNHAEVEQIKKVRRSTDTKGPSNINKVIQHNGQPELNHRFSPSPGGGPGRLEEPIPGGAGGPDIPGPGLGLKPGWPGGGTGGNPPAPGGGIWKLGGKPPGGGTGGNP
jgi:hypothetical protein